MGNHGQNRRTLIPIVLAKHVPQHSSRRPAAHPVPRDMLPSSGSTNIAPHLLRPKTIQRGLPVRLAMELSHRCEYLNNSRSIVRLKDDATHEAGIPPHLRP